MTRTKIKKPRDYNAIDAHFRRSGPMKDLKKEYDKSLCRDMIDEDEFINLYDEEEFNQEE